MSTAGNLSFLISQNFAYYQLVEMTYVRFENWFANLKGWAINHRGGGMVWMVWISENEFVSRDPFE